MQQDAWSPVLPALCTAHGQRRHNAITSATDCIEHNTIPCNPTHCNTKQAKRTQRTAQHSTSHTTRNTSQHTTQQGKTSQHTTQIHTHRRTSTIRWTFWCSSSSLWETDFLRLSYIGMLGTIDKIEWRSAWSLHTSDTPAVLLFPEAVWWKGCTWRITNWTIRTNLSLQQVGQGKIWKGFELMKDETYRTSWSMCEHALFFCGTTTPTNSIYFYILSNLSNFHVTENPGSPKEWMLWLLLGPFNVSICLHPVKTSPDQIQTALGWHELVLCKARGTWTNQETETGRGSSDFCVQQDASRRIIVNRCVNHLSHGASWCIILCDKATQLS